MSEQRFGITVPFEGVPLHEQRDWFAELPDLGYTDVWSSEAGGHDVLRDVARGVGSGTADMGHLGTAAIGAQHVADAPQTEADDQHAEHHGQDDIFGVFAELIHGAGGVVDR